MIKEIKAAAAGIALCSLLYACNNDAQNNGEGITPEESISRDDYGRDSAGAGTIEEDERIRRAREKKNETENTTGEEDADMR